MNPLAVQTNFYRFLFAYALYSLVCWASVAALPLLVTQKFGSGSALVVSLALRMLPHVFFAPMISATLLKVGPKLTNSLGLLGLAIGTLLLPHIDHYPAFQGVNLGIGIVNMGIAASLMTFRSRVLPTGKNIAANAAFITIDRISQILAPILTGFLLSCAPIVYSFYIRALLLLCAALIIATVQETSTATPKQASPTIRASYAALLRLFSSTSLLWVIFLPALGYAILLGGMKPFLLWSTTKTFHRPEDEWILLLTAHGIGAMIGSLLAPRIIAWLRSHVNLLRIYLWARLCTLLWLIGLVGITRFAYAPAILAIAGALEVIGSVCFFTMIQTTLTNRQEAIFHSLSIPLFKLFIVLGTSCSWGYTAHWLGLKEFWLLIIFLAGLPVVSCLFIAYRFPQRTFSA